MGSRLSAIKQNKPGERAERWLVYGAEKTGKTTCAASAPKPLLIPIEDGLGNLLVDALPVAKDFDEVMTSLREIAAEKPPYETIVIDTIDALEPLVQSHVCEREGKKSISNFAHGAGYLLVDTEWIGFLRALDYIRGLGYRVILISHAQTTIVEDPTLGSYVRHSPNVHRRILPLVTAWADAIGYLAREQAAVQRGDEEDGTVRTAMATGVRHLHVEDGGSFVAGNRWGLTDKIAIPAVNGWDAIAAQLAPQTPRKKRNSKKEAA